MNPQDKANETRALLAALAGDPDPAFTQYSWAQEIATCAGAIRAVLAQSDDNVPFDLLLHWRTALDTSVETIRCSEPELWQQFRMPGTWLDGILRLRSVLSHVIVKAYWDGKAEIAYTDIDVARYLWSAR